VLIYSSASTVTEADAETHVHRTVNTTGQTQRDSKILPNGSKYEGTLVNGMANGTGVCIWDSGKYQGHRYEGEFKDDFINGRGKYIFPNGTVYDGEWKKGNRHGLGTFVCADGTYIGQWRDGKKNGQCEWKQHDGTTYNGEWVDDKIHGRGTWVDVHGNTYVGEWTDDCGCIQGHGEKRFANGDVYTGDIKDGKMHGRGKLMFANGDIYEGGYQENMKHGDGAYAHVYHTNALYIGEYRNNNRHGLGTITFFANGNVFDGMWSNGTIDGRGTLTRADGQIQEGIWETLPLNCPQGHIMSSFLFHPPTYLSTSPIFCDYCEAVIRSPGGPPNESSFYHCAQCTHDICFSCSTLCDRSIHFIGDSR